MQPSFLFDRQERCPLHEDPSERADTGASGRTSVGVHAHPFHAAARGILLQHKAHQLLLLEGLDARARQALHGNGVVDAALRCNEARRSDVTFESDAFPGDTETQLDLGAYRHPLDERSEQVRQEDVALMAAVESNFLPQQTGADADPQSHEHSLYWWLLPVARPGASSSTDRRRWPHAFEALACRYAASVRSRIPRWSTMGAG